jgi:hypothetical protein
MVILGCTPHADEIDRATVQAMADGLATDLEIREAIERASRCLADQRVDVLAHNLTFRADARAMVDLMVVPSTPHGALDKAIDVCYPVHLSPLMRLRARNDAPSADEQLARKSRLVLCLREDPSTVALVTSDASLEDVQRVEADAFSRCLSESTSSSSTTTGGS